MTNLEYMKQSIFNQINAMTAEDFYSFMYLLADNNDSNSLDLSGMLTCDDCKIHTVHVLIRVIFA